MGITDDKPDGPKESPLEKSVRRGYITPEDIKNRPQYAVDVINAQQNQFMRTLEQSPSKLKDFTIPLLDNKFNFGDRMYYDSTSNMYTSNPTSIPLYFDSDHNLVPTKTDSPAFFDTDTAYEMTSYYDAVMDTIETTVYKETQGKQLAEEVTPEGLQRLVRSPYELRTEERFPVLLNDQPEMVSFREYGLTDKLGAFEEPARRLWGAAYEGKFGKLLQDVSAIVGVGLQGAGRIIRSGWDLLSASRTGNYNKNVARFMRVKGYNKEADALEQMAKSYEEVLQEQAEKGITPDKAAEMLNNLGNFISNTHQQESSPHDFKVDYQSYRSAAYKYNQAFQIPITSPENFEAAKELIISAERDLNSVSGVYNSNFAYDFVVNPEKQEEYDSLLTQVTLQYGRVLSPWERVQLRQRVANPLTEAVGGILFDFSNLLGMNVGKAFSKMDKASDTYKMLSKFGNVDDLTLGGIATKGIWSVTGKPVFDTVSDAMATHFLVRNLNYKSALPLATSTIAGRIYSDTTDTAVRYLGGAANVIDNPASMDEFIKVGEAYTTLKAHAMSDAEVVAELLKDTSIPATLRTKSRLETIGRMVNVVDPIEKGRRGSWKRLFHSAYSGAFDEVHGRTLADYMSKIQVSDLSKMTGDPIIDDVLRRAQDIPEANRLTVVYNELDSLAKQYAKATITNDKFAQHIGHEFAGIFEDAHTLAQYRTTKLLDGGSTGLFVKAFPQTKHFLAKAAFAHKRFMQGFINSILGRKPAFRYYQIAENLAMNASAGSGNSFARTYNLFANTPALFEHLGDLPPEARRGFYAFLGVDDLRELPNIQKLMKDNPGAWIPSPNTVQIFRTKSFGQRQAKWLDDLLENKGITDSLDKERFLEKIAKDKKLFVLADVPKGKVATFMGKPMRFPLGSLKEYNEAWADAGRAAASLHELTVKAYIAQDHYLTGLRILGPQILDDVIQTTKETLRAGGATDDVIEEAVERISNNWDIADGNASKFQARGKRDAFTRAGLRADTPLPPGIRNVPTGMSAQELDNTLMGIRDDLNSYLTTLKVAGEKPTPENIHQFFETTFDNKVAEINANLNPAGHVAYIIFGEDTGVIMPVSVETQKLLENIRLGKSPTKYTKKLKDLFAENGVDTAGKTVQQAVDELKSKLTTIGWNPPKPVTEEMVQNAIDDCVPYQSLRQAFGEDFYLDKLDQELRLKMVSLDPVKDRSEGAHIVSSIMEDYHAMYPDSPMNLGYQSYGTSRGMFNGEVLYRLEELSHSEPSAKAMYDELMKYDRNVDTVYRYFRDQIDPFVFPGYKFARGKGSGTARTIMKKQVNAANEQFLIKASESLDAITDAVKNGKDVPLPTIGDVMGWRGVSLKVAEDGKSVQQFIVHDFITGLDTPFEKGDPLFDALFSDASYFGIKNKAVWDSPITLEKHQLRDLKLDTIARNPIHGDVPVEQHDALRKEFMNAFISKPFDDKGNSLRFYLEPFFYKESLDDQPVSYMVKRIRDVAKGNSGEVQSAMDELASFIEETDHFFTQRFLIGEETVAFPMSPKTVPDQIRAWGTYKVAQGSQSQGLRNLFDEWEQFILGKANRGRLYPKGMKSASDTALIDSALDTATARLSEMEDILWNGGEFRSITFEGAVPYMKQKMRVPSENVVDSFMKGIVPFWNFATRGAGAWAGIAIEHPNMLAWYQKYMRYSEYTSIQAGLTDSRGQQLPSAKGKILLTQVPGMQLWWSPIASFPFFNYYFSNKPVNKYDDDDPNMTSVQKGIMALRQRGEAYGARVSPLIDVAASIIGMEDKYTTQNAAQKAVNYAALAAGIPTDLIPPFIWNGIDSLIFKVSKPDDPTETWRPQEGWFDPLVEQAILREYLTKAVNATNAEEKLSLAQEADALIREREANPRYASYVSQVRKTDYFQTVAGWFTGVYAKPYYNGDLELYNLRDTNNALKLAINNEVAAQIFYPNVSPVDRYNSFLDTRFNTGEGKLYSLRNKLSWVQDPITGENLEGPERRTEAAKLMDLEAATNAMYDEMQGHYDKFNTLMRGLRIGEEYRDPRADQWRKDLWDSIAATENKEIYRDAKRNWTVGFKPQQLVDAHFEQIWFKMLRAVRPTRDTEHLESWDSYTQRVAEWEANLPKLVNDMMPLFTNYMLVTYGQQAYYEEQDVLGIVDKLKSSTTVDSYNMWDMSADTVVDAALRGWEVMYYDKFQKDLGDITGAMFNDLYPEWSRENPKPTTEQIVTWIKNQPAYKGKWSDEQIRLAMMTPEEVDQRMREVLSAQEAQDAGKTEEELAVGELYDMIWWIPPQRKSEFYRLVNIEGAQLGVEDSDIDMLYEFGNLLQLKDPDKFNALYATVSKVLDRMEVTEPVGQDLHQMAMAQDLNNKFKDMLTMQLGDGYENTVYAYGNMSSSEKKQWRKENPEGAQLVDAYYMLKDQYAKQNTLWAEYYYNKSSGGAYYSGGRRYGGGGGVSRGFVSQGGGQFVGMGMRSTQDVQELLSGKKALGSGGVPKWYPAGASPVLANKLAEGAPLNTTDIKYLKQLAETHPELADEIAPIVG